MKIARDGIVDLTWKEDLLCGAAFPCKVPRWKRILAPLQHWFACTFLGHTSFDVANQFVSDPIPGTGAPAYSVIGLDFGTEPTIYIGDDTVEDFQIRAKSVRNALPQKKT